MSVMLTIAHRPEGGAGHDVSTPTSAAALKPDSIVATRATDRTAL
ncbi:hypothetical protein [Nonomuraea angiospora]|uniref:Uncharacterized protein n=1 Tax=Nonomuraea angiospora TaxID=46172 RepID=A0ABR9M361_9ACTN|nr:hypothetical protein [Nonomuraea angiospora]MBE1586781.1 hypothetical protein [Nonomuraea angiospora]